MASSGGARTNADTTLSWALRSRVDAAASPPLEAVFGAIQAADTLHGIIAARGADALRVACSLALDAVAALEAESDLPAAFRSAARDSRSERQSLLQRLDEPGRALDAAGTKVLELKLPESTAASFIDGAARVYNPTTSAGIGAASGAALGSMILPGIGTAIGGALGAMVGASQMDKRNEKVLEAFDAAASRMDQAVRGLVAAAWDELVRCAHQGGLQLQPSSFFAKAQQEWARLSETKLSDVVAGRTTEAEDAVRGFLAKWGPDQTALNTLLRLQLPPYGRPTQETPEIAQKQLQLYPMDPRSFEAAADLGLEMNEPERALALAEQGTLIAPTHWGLALTRIEALAASGQADEAHKAAAAAVSAGAGYEPFYHLARGLTRAGEYQAAADVAAQWQAAAATSAAVRVRLSADPILAVLFQNGLLHPPTETEHPRAVAETYLSADGVKSHFGIPPGDQGKNAQAEFLKLKPHEKVVFFYDWSVWGNGKTGFAITTRRVLWKCLWENPVQIDLSKVSSESIRREGSVLRVAHKDVDMDDEDLADGVVSTLSRMSVSLAIAPPPRSDPPTTAVGACPNCGSTDSGRHKAGHRVCFSCKKTFD